LSATVTVVVTASFALGACSSSSPSSTPPDAAPYDGAVDSDRVLSFEFSNDAVEFMRARQLRDGVSRTMASPDGGTTVILWSAFLPLQENEFSWDTNEVSVFAAPMSLATGAVLSMAAETDVALGDTYRFNSDFTFAKEPDSLAPQTAVVLEIASGLPPAFTYGLSATFTVNGRSERLPYGAVAGNPGDALEFMPSNVVTVFTTQYDQDGTVIGVVPAESQQVDLGTAPGAHLEWDPNTGWTCELESGASC
jgi:hypothetical protein